LAAIARAGGYVPIMSQPASSPTHMPMNEFRRRGHAMIDAVADYWESLQSPGAPPVLCPRRPGDVLESIPADAPEHPEPFDDIMADVHRLIVPGLTHWQHPSFFAYFPSNGSAPAVLGDLLSTGLGVQGMLWATSPACTELETRVTDWMARALGLPGAFLAEPGGPAADPWASAHEGGGVIQGTASESTLVALLAARHRLASSILALCPPCTAPTRRTLRSSRPQ